MFSTTKTGFQQPRWKTYTPVIVQNTGKKIHLAKMLGELEQAQIISRDGDIVRFKYRACYCYFVAKYFQENLAAEESGTSGAVASGSE